MPLGEVTTALILARQAAFKGLSDFANHTVYAGNPSKHNAWKALSIVLASVGHSSAAPSSIASYSKLCERARGCFVTQTTQDCMQAALGEAHLHSSA